MQVLQNNNKPGSLTKFGPLNAISLTRKKVSPSVDLVGIDRVARTYIFAEIEINRKFNPTSEIYT